MNRHIRQNCKVVKQSKLEALDEIKQLPPDDILAAQQKIEQLELVVRTHKSLQEQIDQLRKEQAQLIQPQTITNNTINTVNNVVAQIHIHPWGGVKTLRIPGESITAAFTENPRLAEYCDMQESDKYDEEKSKMYILEALMELTKRAHTDPIYRNVYLNPNRSDQAMVCIDDAKWEVCPLSEATKVLFESVASEVHAALPLSPAKGAYVVPIEIQSGAGYVPTMYKSNPQQYIDMAKALITAHLANIAPISAKRRPRECRAPRVE